MASIQTAAWLGQAIPPAIVTMPMILVGGTALPEEFLGRVALSTDPGELWICAPFIDRDIAVTASGLRGLNHSQLDLVVLTANRRNALNAHQAMAGFRWRSVTVAVKLGLHAKIYLFISPRSRCCVIGSHNFTRAGFAGNFEAGVLLASTGGDQVDDLVTATHQSLAAELRTAKPVEHRPAHGGE